MPLLSHLSLLRPASPPPQGSIRMAAHCRRRGGNPPPCPPQPPTKVPSREKTKCTVRKSGRANFWYTKFWVPDPPPPPLPAAVVFEGGLSPPFQRVSVGLSWHRVPCTPASPSAPRSLPPPRACLCAGVPRPTVGARQSASHAHRPWRPGLEGRSGAGTILRFRSVPLGASGVWRRATRWSCVDIAGGAPSVAPGPTRRPCEAHAAQGLVGYSGGGGFREGEITSKRGLLDQAQAWALYTPPFWGAFA